MFLTVLSTDGEPVGERERALYTNRMRALAGPKLVVVEEDAFYALVAPAMVPLRPLIARGHGLVGIGNVRLDNREEVNPGGGAEQLALSDLEVLLDAYDGRGARCIPDLLGDFAFVIYDPRERAIVAGRDAFGVKTLFVAERSGAVVLSSHLELVHDREDLDEEFVADFLLGGDPGPERTIWADSRAVAQGSILTAGAKKVATQRFWNPYDFEPAEGGDERTQVDRFRQLFRDAVRLRVEPNGQTWAELSGGLDSSSVVSTAQTLATEGILRAGLAGTVSVVDDLGDGNEQRFSELVVRRFAVPNQPLPNTWPWRDDGRQPPRTDEPRSHYPFFARDQRITEFVCRAGGSVLLSGWGSDHYLYGSRLFISDALALGRVGSSLRSVAHWSIAERRSFWDTLAREVLLPLAPAALQRPFSERWDRIPAWITRQFRRRTELSKRLWFVRVSEAPRGSRFSRQMAAAVQELTQWLPHELSKHQPEFRHPFLYRPLVEHGLRLPPTMRVRPLSQKWVLRQAMKGVLPEEIRLRPGKGGIDARVLWALDRERGRIDEILKVPFLSEVGIISAAALRAAVDAARRGMADNVAMLLCALGLETWLFVRSGRWALPSDDIPLAAHRCRAR